MACFLTIALGRAALAVENDEAVGTEGETITVTAPVLADLSPSSVTVVDLQDHYGRGEELTDVLARVPGVAIRRSGALGSFTSIAIRGLGGRNVGVVLDDQPLSNVALGPIDFALLPLETIERLEVYRGAAPVRFSGPLAGVVRLRTEDPGEELRLSALAGYGSFDTRSASLSASGPLTEAWGFAAGAVYQGTTGDFVYYDDRETLYTTADDRRVRRSNNASNAGSARFKLTHAGPADGRVTLSLNGFVRDQGIAGSGARPTTSSTATDAEVLARLALDGAQLGRLFIGAGVDALYGRRTFSDPEDEVGLAIADSNAALTNVAVDGRAAYAWSLAQTTELTPRLGVERFQQSGLRRSATFAARELDRTRLLFGSGLEHRLFFDAWILAPSLRLDVERNQGTAVAGVGNLAELSPRIGVLRSFADCSVRLNVGRYHRMPTSSERFGDGITTIANPNLRSEQGVAADAGGRCVVHGAFGLLTAELMGFVTRANRLIALVQNSQLTGIATNLGATHIDGIEASAQLQRSWLAVLASYTLTVSRDASEGPTRGNRTPGLPLHDAHAQARVGPPPVGVRYEVDVRSSAMLDAGNLRPVPPRVLHGLGVEWLFAGLTLALTVRNLTDRIVEDVTIAGADRPSPSKVSDYIGYPLPGRSFFISLRWRNP